MVSGVIPPGEHPKKPGKPNAVRLYSIASTRYGDYLDGETVSLCVRRAVYWDKELGKEDPAKKGVCSLEAFDVLSAMVNNIRAKIYRFGACKFQICFKLW